MLINCHIAAHRVSFVLCDGAPSAIHQFLAFSSTNSHELTTNGGAFAKVRVDILNVLASTPVLQPLRSTYENIQEPSVAFREQTFTQNCICIPLV